MKTLMQAFLFGLLISSCAGPLYKPGDLRESEKYDQLLREAPGDAQQGYFTINDSIQLHYFTKGNGEPVLVLHGGSGYPFTKPWQGLDSLCEDYRFYYYHQRGCGNV